MQAQNTPVPQAKPVDLYIASTDESSMLLALKLADDLRSEGVSVQIDVAGRSVKAQMKFANKIGALYTAVLGSDEVANGRTAVKCMEDGTTTELELEDFAEHFISMSVNKSLEALGGSDGDFDISSLLGGSL